MQVVFTLWCTMVWSTRDGVLLGDVDQLVVHSLVSVVCGRLARWHAYGDGGCRGRAGRGKREPTMEQSKMTLVTKDDLVTRDDLVILSA